MADAADMRKVLASLKDFQRDSVEYVFDRLFLDPDSTHRFLVADEVGLGKTLVAKGIIAKTIEHLTPKVDRIDIVYICSNADIARQNVNRLNVVDQGTTLPTRITKLPMKVRDLAKNRVNFISLTPGTSFDLGDRMGQAEERALLYWILKEPWGLRGRGVQRLLQGRSGSASFGTTIKTFDHAGIDDTLAQAFIHRLQVHAEGERAAGGVGIRDRFESLASVYARARISEEDRRARYKLVSELRSLLAETCIEALEPDLIILDEFQRFKNLLHGNDGPAALAQGMFEYEQETAEGSKHAARVLLLSATPYKMYTVAGEGEDDHYRDFVDTLSFLLKDETRTTHVEELLKRYRSEMFRIGIDGPTEVHAAREELEQLLRGVMVRTERLGMTEDRNGMLVEVPATGVTLREQDVREYVALQRVADALDEGNVLEYWKSAPYLLNFMDSYKLKQSFRKGIGSRRLGPEIASALRSSKGVLLPWRAVREYRAIDAANGRMRALMADTIDAGAWRLLWIPPTAPYYEPSGPFADERLRGFTKRLIFSSWVVVPKVVSSLVSYEAERLAMLSERSDARNTRDERQKRRGLLRFTADRTSGTGEPRLTGMPVLAMLYPSTVLADVCDPQKLETPDEESTTADALLSKAEADLTAWLAPLIDARPTEGPEDETWYWAAPILLDLEWQAASTRAWFNRTNLASLWAGAEGDDDDESSWGEHVAQARALLDGDLELGRPPADLVATLALLGVSGPGVCALRALARVSSGPKATSKRWARDSAARIGWAFRSLFNKPESMAIVRGLARSAREDEAYWRLTLEYALSGNLQALLDEYAHVLRESEGLADKKPEEIAQGVSAAVARALTLRTTVPRVENLRVDRHEVRAQRVTMRGHFALSFGQERSESEDGSQRPELVREAFNSPFWPFVVASTSVGQEGLDFHTYCHAVVHWNLPSNPVDLEQREGRVHRYKGHAVRKNVATTYSHLVAGDGADPWTRMFDAARADRGAADNDLVPYWLYAIEGGARIERHVPTLPLSREVGRLNALRRSLVAYRMVFGQPRQDDLLEYLLRRLSPQELHGRLDELRIDLSPPKSARELPDD